VTEYERHELEKTLLNQVVREHLEGFLARSSRRYQPTPRVIEQELRAFLRCGVLANGFLRVDCTWRPPSARIRCASLAELRHRATLAAAQKLRTSGSVGGEDAYPSGESDTWRT
jgi:hypothetical protein